MDMNFNKEQGKLNATQYDFNIDLNNPENIHHLQEYSKMIKSSYYTFMNFSNEEETNSNEENELYEYILDMIQNQIKDNSIQCNNNLLFPYLQEAFQKDDKAHKRILEKVKKHPTKYPLAVTLVRADNLTSKQAKNYTDPFCVLYLESSPDKWFISSVQSDTVNPEWEENFEFNINYDTLCVQIWYRKVASSFFCITHKNRKSAKFLEAKLKSGVNAKTILKKQGHKFLGQCKIPLNSIPTNCDIQMYPLMKNNKPESRGDVILKFNLNHNEQSSLEKHRRILQILYLHELKNRETTLWLGNWSSLAKILIEQHILYAKLSYYKELLLRWVLYCHLNKTYPISCSVFYDILSKLVEIFNESNHAEKDLECFWDSTKLVLHSCLYFIQNIRELQHNGEIPDIIKQQAMHVMRIFHLLYTLNNSSNIDMISENTKNLCVTEWYNYNNKNDGYENLNLKEALELALIQKSEKQLRKYENSYFVNADFKEYIVEFNLNFYCKFMDSLWQDIVFARKVTDIFSPTFNFSYIERIYVLYTERYAHLFGINITKYNNNIESYKPLDKKRHIEQILNLYFKIKKLFDFGKEFCSNKMEDLQINKFHEWFSNSIHYCFKQCGQFCLDEITMLIKNNPLQEFNIFNSFERVENLQKEKMLLTERCLNLCWPNPHFYFDLMMDVNLYLYDYYKQYTKEMIQKYTDLKTKKKIGFEEGLIVISKIEHIISCCKDENKKYFLREIDMKNVVESGKIKSRDIIIFTTHFDQFIEEKLIILQKEVEKFIVDYIFEAKPELKRHINEVDKNIAGNYIFPFSDLRECISKLWHQPVGFVSVENYMSIKRAIRTLTLDLFYETLEKKKKTTISSLLHYNEIYKEILMLLEIREDIPEFELESIQSKILLHLTNTDHLIHQYLIERCQRQKKLLETSYGFVTFKLIPSYDDLIVVIVSCDAVNPADKNGKMKPYVKIRCSDFIRDSSDEKYKTDCNKPYPQSVIIPNQVQSSWMFLEIYYKNKLKSTYLGEIVYELRHIDDRIITLPLSPPDNNAISRILEKRKDDETASKFMMDMNFKCDH